MNLLIISGIKMYRKLPSFLTPTAAAFGLMEEEKVAETTAAVRREIARRYLLELAERDDQNMRYVVVCS
jgi:hypothetical protein